MPTLAQNIFKSFRSTGPKFSGLFPGGFISKTFDEPTYLTFRIGFRSANNSLDWSNYDKMPHPLFEDAGIEDDINARNSYSTRQFLRDSNELVRESMLWDFMNKWNDLQNNFQWYFQSISGLDSILKIDPKRGKRVGNDGKITIKMLESLDWKVTHMLNLYRKIAWDDVYQRWILPDMMRYFMMDIYITEFRVFHTSNLQGASDLSSTPPDKSFLQKQKEKYLPKLSNRFEDVNVPEMILTAVDDLMPTYVLHCERCEFDITSFNSHLNDLTVNDSQMAEISFDVKVGNITEEYRNPILDFYYTDRIINGFERTEDPYFIADIDYGEGNEGQVVPPFSSTLSITNNSKARVMIHPDIDYGEKASHISGRPFNETSGSGTSNITNSGDARKGPTWLGNTVKFGKAFVENLVDSNVDKLKMTKIPGLGISFNEGITALQSKNIFDVFSLVRKSMTQSLEATAPSERLEEEIIDGAFRAFLLKLSKSEATDGDTNLNRLAQAANLILNDQGKWEQIKDLSKATDLLSAAFHEVNIGKPLENPNTYKTTANLQTGNDKSFATDLGGPPSDIMGTVVYEGIPTSTSTTRKIEEQKIERPKLGSTEGVLQKPEINTGISQATSEITPLEKGSFLGGTSNPGLQAGGVENVEPGKATSSDIEGGKWFFGGVAKNSNIIKGNLHRPEPGEATDGDKIE